MILRMVRNTATPARVPGRGSGDLQQLLQEPFPRMLMLQTTSACNASCVFCPLPGLRTELPQGRISRELFGRIVREAGEHPDQVSCLNLFLMNEPLSDRRIVERIHLAARHNPGAQISLWTNAVALRPELTERLLDSPLTSLGVSLHAHRPETYQRITGRKDFSRILRDLVHFVERRLARRPDLTLVLRYVGAEQFMSPAERQELSAFWSEGQLILDVDPGYLSRAGNLEAPGAVRVPHRRVVGCKAFGGPKQAHVLYTGQVVLCCMDYQRRTDLGDLSRQSLHQVWRGEPRRQLLEMLYGLRDCDPDFLCSRCELAMLPGEEAEEIDPGVPPDAVWAAV
jgi:hypothetical protein